MYLLAFSVDTINAPKYTHVHASFLITRACPAVTITVDWELKNETLQESGHFQGILPFKQQNRQLVYKQTASQATKQLIYRLLFKQQNRQFIYKQTVFQATEQLIYKQTAFQTTKQLIYKQTAFQTTKQTVNLQTNENRNGIA